MYDSIIRSVVVSAVLLSKIESEIKLLLMKRVKGDYWCHVAGKVEDSTEDGQPSDTSRNQRRKPPFSPNVYLVQITSSSFMSQA